MKTEQEQTSADQIIEEASDPLGAPDSQEESDDNWSPDDLSPEQRQQYDRAVKAVDDFIEKHPTYKATDKNRQAILDYLESHDLAISPASLELVWEQIGDRLDLEPEQRDSTAGAGEPDASMPDASTRLATAGLARGTRVESEDSDQSQDSKPSSSSQPQKKPTAWRNGKEIEVVS